MTDAAAPLHDGTTIRMRIAPEQALDGYIFTNDDHAKRWLLSLQPNVAAAVRLERVLVGGFRRCPRCEGQGSIRSVTRIADVSLEEVLRND